MSATADADNLLQRSKQESNKAREAMSAGAGTDVIYLHRKNAVRFYAQAMSVLRRTAAAH